MKLRMVMLKISIVPDTNILLTDLSLIEYLYHSQFEIQHTINYSKTVLNELDYLKKSNHCARKAIKYIESVSTFLQTEIEGRLDERKLDIVIESKEPIKPKNNDDKILNYCFQLENPILLTNDRAFFLKCNSYNIKSIIVNEKSPITVVAEIYDILGIRKAIQVTETELIEIEMVKESIKSLIRPQILSILESGGNPEVFSMLDPSKTLEDHLKMVMFHFAFFSGFLPQDSPKIIDEFLKTLESNDINSIKQQASNICFLFRTKYQED